MLMVQAGPGTDATIQALLPHLDKGDILIDGGNTFYKDTIRRNEELANSGINFIGTGVSGGEKGALEGPSIMPGGQKEAYELVADVLEEISAKAPEDGKPCVTYIGPDGAGHYVKMVHNGIEYGDMQLIAESYDLMQHLLGLSAEDMAEIFTEWNKGELDSYLIEITADILSRKDDEGQDGPIVDYILDAAGNKGTGKWTSQSALDLGVPLSLITESVFARYISTYKEERVHASKVLPKPAVFKFEGDKAELIEKIRQALYFSKIISYAQGFAQLRVASKENNWNLPFADIASFTQKQSALTVSGKEEDVHVEPPKPLESWVKEAAKLKGVDSYYVTNSTNVTLSYKDKKVERATLTGGNSTYMNAVENEIVAGRSLRQQDYKEFASVILLDEELAKSLFDSPEAAVNQIISVNEFSYRVIGVYTSNEAKGQLEQLGSHHEQFQRYKQLH